MFPIDIPTVLLLLGFIAFAYLLNEAIVYIIAGFVVLIINFRDSTNEMESILMAIIAVYLMYKGATIKK